MTTDPHSARRAELARALCLCLSLVLTLGLWGCSGAETSQSTENDASTADGAAGAETESVDDKARRLAQEMLIVDTHIDVPYRLKESWDDVSARTESGDFDYVRAREGGLNGAFMSIYIPAKYQEGGAKEVADELIDMVEGIVAEHPDKFAIALSPDDLLRQQEEGLVSFPLGMENGAPVEDDLANLEHFYARGIRYITLTHSKNNQISDSSYEEPDERRWDGLSPFGREVIAEMNRLGIMVDISHVSDAAFEDAIEVSRAPMIATHSSARAFTPGFERNMSDEMIEALAAKDGVIAINFGSAFLTAAANSHSQDRWSARDEALAARGLEPDSAEAQAWMQSDEAKATMAEYLEKNPFPYATLDDVIAHIDHVVKLVGIEHVGIGSDYDGVGDSLPTGLKDVSAYPNLVRGMLEKGYSDEDIEKILGGNVLRVWRAVEEVAAEMQGAELREAA